MTNAERNHWDKLVAQTGMARREFCSVVGAGTVVLGTDTLAKAVGAVDLGNAFLGWLLDGQDPLAVTPALLRQDLNLHMQLNPGRQEVANRLNTLLTTYRPLSVREYFDFFDRERFRFSPDPVLDSLTVAAWYGWFGEETNRRNLPLYIPDGRSGPQSDKIIHFSANALRSYRTFKALNEGYWGIDNASQFLAGIDKMINFYIGRENFSSIKEKMRREYVPSFDLKAFGIKDPVIQGIIEKHFDLGLLFEILTTAIPGEVDPGEDASINKISTGIVFDRLFNGGLRIDQFIKTICIAKPDMAIRTGVLDGMGQYDLLADSLAVLWGYALAKRVNESKLSGRRHRVKLSEVPVPYDDFSQKFPQSILNYQTSHKPFPQYPFPDVIRGLAIEGGKRITVVG